MQNFMTGGAAVPFSYEQLNIYESSYSPSTVHVENSALARFFARYLFQKVISVFKWQLPKNWDEDYFKYVLYAWGYIGVVRTDKFGIICQHGSRYGYNVYYQPTNLIITNPLIKGSLNPEIGKTCSVIKLQPDWGSALDIVDYYADQMALCAESISINLLNSHVCTVFPAKNKAAAESYKKLYDKVAGGEPAVVLDADLFKEDGSISWDVFQQNLKENYIASDIIIDLRKLESEFDTKIGIKNANTDKRERLITEEVEANDQETEILASLWLETLQRGVEQTKELFGITDLSVTWRNNPKGGKADEERKPERNGAI